MTGSGSGIIIGQNDKELLVLTNYHVIDGASSLKVTFIDDSVVAVSYTHLDVYKRQG